MKKFLLGTLIIAFILCGFIFPETVTLTKVGDYGTGYYFDVFVQGNFAYCAASGAGLDIINISTPGSPTFVANCDTPGEANGVYVSGNYAYVADSESGLQIIDISTPASAHIEGSCDTPGIANAVFVSGDLAYVADGESGLRIVDVADRALPHSEGTLDTPGYAWEVFLSGSLAYVADGTSGVQIINVATPATPTPAGSFSTTGTDAEARGIWVSGVYAYVAYWGIGLRIYDVTTPSAVVAKGFIDETWEAWAVQINGSYAYVAGDGNDLQVIDITNPDSPSIAGSYDTGGWGKAVYITGAYAYLADYSLGLQIFNVPTPTPFFVGKFDRSGYQHDVYVSGDYAYMAYRSGLQIYDVSTPSNPILRSNYATPGDGAAVGVFVVGYYAYVADGGSGLQIINVSNPESPSWAGACDTDGYASSVFISGSYAYVADGDNGLEIIDISTPASAHIEGPGYNTPGTAYSVFVSSGYAYIADGGSGLQIINITNPSSPSFVGVYNTSGDARGIYISGYYAYVGDYNSGLQIINIETPSSPSFVGVYDTPGYAYGVFVKDNCAYVADWDRGLQVINVSTSSSPTYAASSDTIGYSWDVFVSGNYAYLADGSSGKLYIYEISHTLTVSGTVTRGGTGLAGVVMNGLTGNPTTDGSGVYTAQVNYGWSGTVTPTISGNAFIPASRTYSNVTSDQTTQDYVAGYTVSGTVLRGGLGLQSVVMSGLPGNPTTNSSGIYSVTVAHGFSGTATPTLVGNTFSPPSIVYTSVTSDQMSQDYTATLLTYTITGTVTRGGVGLQGVVMNGLTGNPTTNSSGVYTATVDYGFSGTATPTLAGNTFTPPTRTYSNVTSNQTAQDYTTTLNTLTISGTVTAGGAGLQGVVMSGLPGSPTTDSSGVYTATVDYGFSGTATPTLSGYSFTPPTRTYSNVTSNQTAQDYTSVLFTYTISGTITAGGAALPGVVVSGLPGSPTTNSSGVYAATVDYGFSGTATPVLAGYAFTPPSRTYSSVTADQTGQDYTSSTVTLTISGTITSGGSGLQGVVMTGLPASPATDSSGVYTATVDYGFSGTATPTLAGYTFTPPSRTYSTVTSSQTGQDYTATLIPPPVILLSRSRLNFGATTSLKTSDQKFTISNSGSGTLDWSITDDAAWLSCSSTSGTGGAEITVAVDTTGLTSNTYNATITVSSTNASNSPQTVTVSLVVKAVSQVQNPFGFFDTPVNGTTGITGAIPVTGWALDDIEVTRIEIKRDPVAADPAGARGADGLVFIGDAVFVEEARPDVEQTFPNSPLNYRAGWGYMLLTYGLPDQGNGSYKLYAFAHDKDGHRIGLGNKTFQCDNAHATKPFGTLDTPSQGGTASGTLANFGWALTPMPNEIPRDGSTISVYVDGVYLGQPVYNLYRADIAAAFPGYANSDGAVGLYSIDTTPYSNRVHTIGWQVTDNNGNSEGIGSRFFTVFNSSPAKLTGEMASVQGLRTALSPDEIRRLPARSSSVQFRKGVSPAERWQLGRMNREGTNSIQIREVDRVEIQLGQSGNIQGFMAVGKDLRPLPIGSTLDGRSGTFYWQPGPGFKGDYNFVFIGEDADGRPVKTALTITIAPKS